MLDSYEYFIGQLINGITLGTVYGLIAIGYTMVYGVVGMINFAHGDIFMVGSFLSLMIFLLLGLVGITWVPLAVGIVLIGTVLLTPVYGWTIERVAYRPLRSAPRLAPLITAIGTSIFLENYVQVLQGAKNKPLQPVIKGSFEILRRGTYSVSVSTMQIFMVVLTAVLMVGFTILISRTSLGRAQRACEQDMGMAALVGVNVDRTISLTFVMGSGLAAVAGLMFLLNYGVIDFFIGFLAGIKAFTAAVLGGIGSLPGAVLGGILIGLIEVFWSSYFSTDYKDVAAFMILAITLIFLPSGILGRPEVEKV